MTNLQWHIFGGNLFLIGDYVTCSWIATCSSKLRLCEQRGNIKWLVIYDTVEE